MCGIGGLIGGRVPGLAASLQRLLRHRGPDGQGAYEDPRGDLTLVHTRLAILDLSDHAAQPMTSPDGRHVLVFNGEIYNFRDLRKELEGAGERFVSTGDTEVLLRGLATQGEAFLSKLNGIFAFALWDARERTLLLGRDPAGVKPLYYASIEPGVCLFASEIKAFYAHPGFRPAPDLEAILQHLAFSHASGERTAFDGVRRVPAGSTLRLKPGDPAAAPRRFWSPRFSDPTSPRGDAAVERLRSAVRQSVVRQLVSDVPVGMFLSGGLDSTLIGAVAAPELRDGLRSFTIRFPEGGSLMDSMDEDAVYARKVAAELGLKHQEVEMNPQVAELWPEIIRHLDEPIADPAAIASTLICRLAREANLKVLLSGQGSDELFAGYPRYPAMQMTGAADAMPKAIGSGLAKVARLLPGGREGWLGKGTRRIKRVLTSLDVPPDQRFLAYCAHSPDEAIFAVLSPELKAALGNRAPASACVERMEAAGLTGVDRWLERDLSVYLPNHNLLYTDKTSMASGVEVRVPLIDLEIVDLATRFPPDLKIQGTTTKAVLRAAARGLVSQEILDRPKAGFGAPYRKWLRYDLAEMWNDLTQESVVKKRGWFDVDGVRAIREESQSGRSDLYMLQWAILTIELWARQFLDGRPSV
jgi:asparagine synthase (glutamine-hydrolysing)